MAQIVSANVVQDSSLQLWVDMAWPGAYVNYSTTVNTLNYRPFTIDDLPYSSYANNAITWTRTTSPAPKEGGGMQLEAYTNTALASTNFLYNDHTWEIWARINDINPGSYDGTEGLSALAAFRGYHSGFLYTASTMYYYVWSSTGPTMYNPVTWTVGTSGAQINQGSWYQMVVTRSGNSWQGYLNGAATGNPTTQDIGREFTETTNNLWIGKVGAYAPGALSYVYYSKNTFSNMRMYSRALSAAEVRQNFNALRGRFGL